MIAFGPHRRSARRQRALAGALLTALLWTIVAPVAEAWHAHADDRCCRNGICCCKPKDLPPGPCIGTACRCAGHEADPAGAPVVRQLLPPTAFRLLVRLSAHRLPPPPSIGPEAGFLAPPFHPPRLRCPLSV